MTPEPERASRADELEAALARARLLVLDVDGTLTDGSIRYLADEELQTFCVRDGQGLVWLRRAGVALAWISGRGCRATERRANELGVEELHLGSRNKRATLAAVQARLGVSSEQTIAMGDDLPDLAFAPLAACFVSPSDGRAEVRAAAQLVTSASGGKGAVRELCERMLGARGQWPVPTPGPMPGEDSSR